MKYISICAELSRFLQVSHARGFPSTELQFQTGENIPTCPRMHIAPDLKRGDFRCPADIALQDGGSPRSDPELRFEFSVVEPDRVRPPQRLQPSVIPGGEQLGPDAHPPPRAVHPVGPAGQELHQRVGDPEEGTDPPPRWPGLQVWSRPCPPGAAPASRPLAGSALCVVPVRGAGSAAAEDRVSRSGDLSERLP